MENKLMPFYRIQEKLKLSDAQVCNSIKTANKRHREDMWILYRNDATGVRRAYFYLEGVAWIEDVYLRNDIYYVDAEIEFAEKQITRLEKELQRHKDYFIYEEKNINQLCGFFDVKERSIRDAIRKLVAVSPTEKIKRQGRVFITARGVKWLEENIYRKKYLRDLLTYKRFLQSVKRGELTW